MMTIDKNKIESCLRRNKKPPGRGKIAKTYAKTTSKGDTPNKQYKIKTVKSKKHEKQRDRIEKRISKARPNWQESVTMKKTLFIRH